jgi:hypothetical protein
MKGGAKIVTITIGAEGAAVIKSAQMVNVMKRQKIKE